MFGRSKTTVLKDNAASGKDLALALSRDKKFRKQLISAVGHGTAAKRKAASRMGTAAVAARLAADEDLRRELATMTKNLQQAWTRVEKKRSHKLRNTVFVLGSGAAAFGAFKCRTRRGWAMPAAGRAAGPGDSKSDESIEVGVPVAPANNQPTQLEGVPLFKDSNQDV